MKRAVVTAVRPTHVTVRLLDGSGTVLRAHNSLLQRPPPGHVVVLTEVRREWYIVGRPR